MASRYAAMASSCLPSAAKRSAEVAVRVVVVRSIPDGLTVVRDRFLAPSALAEHDREVVVDQQLPVVTSRVWRKSVSSSNQ